MAFMNPNTKQKMKVNLAAQVLSHSVAGVMFANIAQGCISTDATVTANVVSKMDKLFDALNSDSSDLRRGKPFSTNMSRTSPHLGLFNEMKEFFRSLKFVGSARRPPSKVGWIWTIKAIEKFWHGTIHTDGLKRLATRRLQQDPLENLFGCIRANCGSNSNPTCGQFVAGLKTAILSNVSHVGISGNCESDTNQIINNLNSMLSVKQKKHCSENVAIINTVSELLPFEIEEAFVENTGEIQACAYVCGFLIKKLPIEICDVCKAIFLANSIDQYHLFVQNKEYDSQKNSLNYASKDLIANVEFCATLINSILNEKPYIKSIGASVIEQCRLNANFDYMAKCAIHMDENINILLKSIFMICVKRYCIKKNRSFATEAASSSLKRKMQIIVHN